MSWIVYVSQRGHLNRYLLMIQMTGATVVPYGFINGPGSATCPQVRAAMNARTAAAYFVTAWHRHHRGELSLRDTVEVAHEHGVPVVVDAADVPDIRSATAAGADLVAISGGKNLLGPGSSGLIAGRADLIQACRMQGTGWGIGRPMKVSKEEIAGLIVALERYGRLDHQATWDEWHARCRGIAARLRDLPGVAAQALERDDAGGPAAFVQITLDEKRLGRTANDVNDALVRGNPSIRIREYFAYVGTLEVDVRTLLPEEEDVLVARLRQELGS